MLSLHQLLRLNSIAPSVAANKPTTVPSDEGDESDAKRAGRGAFGADELGPTAADHPSGGTLSAGVTDGGAVCGHPSVRDPGRLLES